MKSVKKMDCRLHRSTARAVHQPAGGAYRGDSSCESTNCQLPDSRRSSRLVVKQPRPLSDQANGGCLAWTRRDGGIFHHGSDSSIGMPSLASGLMKAIFLSRNPIRGVSC